MSNDSAGGPHMAARAGGAPAGARRMMLVGHPVAHSLSPALYRAAYPLVGLHDWVYELVDCPTARAARERIGQGGFKAANITTPYKALALALAARVVPRAYVAGGANVLVAGKSGLVADNTDGAGCVAFLKHAGAPVAGARVVVCGTGATACAVAAAVASAGAEAVVLLGRNGGRARARLADLRARMAQVAFSGAGQALEGACSYDDARARRALSACDVVVDATPLGMAPDDPPPFDALVLHAGQWVLDCTYAQGDTALVREARAAGARAAGGVGMLVGQAIEALHSIAAVHDRSLGCDERRLFEAMAAAAGFVTLGF